MFSVSIVLQSICYKAFALYYLGISQHTPSLICLIGLVDAMIGQCHNQQMDRLKSTEETFMKKDVYGKPKISRDIFHTVNLGLERLWPRFVITTTLAGDLNTFQAIKINRAWVFVVNLIFRFHDFLLTFVYAINQ